MNNHIHLERLKKQARHERKIAAYNRQKAESGELPEADRSELIDDATYYEALADSYEAGAHALEGGIGGAIVDRVKSLRTALSDLLKGGHHEGDCVHPYDDEYCEVHQTTEQQRRAEAERLLKDQH